MQNAAAVSIALWTLEIGIHITLPYHTRALQAFSSRYLCEERIPIKGEDANLGYLHHDPLFSADHAVTPTEHLHPGRGAQESETAVVFPSSDLYSGFCALPDWS